MNNCIVIERVIILPAESKCDVISLDGCAVSCGVKYKTIF
jgi:uncharacterized metal-binding protein